MNSFSLPYTYTIGGVARASCLVVGLSVDAFEQGAPGIVKYRIKNTGTVLQQQVATLVINGELFSWNSAIKPTQEEAVSNSFAINLPPGEYDARFAVEACDFVENVRVKVVLPGSLRRAGEFSLNAVAQDEESVLPVSASFANTGEVAVAARLSGVILSGEQTLRVFEGESLLVLPGQTADFTEYVDGLPEGEYVIRAKIVYDGGSSSEKEVLAKIATVEKEDARFSFNPLSFLLVVVPVILLLLIMIREKRRR
jgi:hypothetical protein